MKTKLNKKQVEVMERVNALYPCFDPCDSFYNKALVYDDEEVVMLYSYFTAVCVLDKKNKKYCLNPGVDIDLLLSNTTLRHIKEFLKQYMDSSCDYHKKDFEKVVYGLSHKDKNYDPSLIYLF